MFKVPDSGTYITRKNLQIRSQYDIEKYVKKHRRRIVEGHLRNEDLANCNNVSHAGFDCCV